MKYSLNWLKEEVQAGKPVEYLFFWGHTQKADSIIDKSCLSQWFTASFTVNGVSYATAEHWMMAQKALLFGDEAAFKEVLITPKPGAVKAIGRKVTPFDAVIWKTKCFDIVAEGSFHKFSQHEPLRQFLLHTGKRVIVEASPRDTIWGIGLGQDSPAAQNPSTWRGTNLLGFALMEARDRLLNG
jgi:ribA/ribD-fused uncharacterized protein